MQAQMVEAVRLLESLNVGDPVTVTDQGQTAALIVSRSARRSDGAYGSYESTHVTVTYGPGRCIVPARAL